MSQGTLLNSLNAGMVTKCLDDISTNGRDHALWFKMVFYVTNPYLKT